VRWWVSSIGIGHPVAERRSERLRERDSDPVERFHLRRGDGGDRYGALRPVPRAECGDDAGEQQRRASGIADTQGTIGEVGRSVGSLEITVPKAGRSSLIRNALVTRSGIEVPGAESGRQVIPKGKQAGSYDAFLSSFSRTTRSCNS
jgi:hypothetical protein